VQSKQGGAYSRNLGRLELKAYTSERKSSLGSISSGVLPLFVPVGNAEREKRAKLRNVAKIKPE